MGNYFSAGAVEEALTGDQTTETPLPPSNENTGSSINDSHSDTGSTSDTESEGEVNVEPAAAAATAATAPAVQEERFMNLERFDISQIGMRHNVAILGRAATGKTTLVRDIIRQNRDNITTGRAYSIETHNYKQYFPEYAVKPLFTGDDFSRYTQNLVDANVSMRAAIVFDGANCEDAKEVIRQIIMSHRNLKIITMQYPEGLIPAVRANIDFVFIYRESNMGTRKRIHQQYLSRMMPFEEFNMIMTQLSNYTPYTALVLDRRQDKLFWYRANIVPQEQFKLVFV